METNVNQNKLEDSAIHEIASIMALPYHLNNNYIKGPQLVKLFNRHGFNDYYDFDGGKGFVANDLKEKISRAKYVVERLRKINGTNKVIEVLDDFCNTVPDQTLAQKMLSPFYQNLRRINEDKHILNVSPSNKFESLDKSINKDMLRIEEQDTKPIYTANNTKKNIKSPIVFISYSWDSKEHCAWVLKIANDLRNNGIDVLLDQYEEIGTNMVKFMNNSIEKADKVIIIGTPNYKNKSTNDSGGAAFEGCIITTTIYNDLDTKVFVPCLKYGEFSTAFPKIIGTRKGFDFTKDDSYNDVLDDLSHSLWNSPLIAKPNLGNIPPYVK